MSDHLDRLLTSGELSRELGVPVHRVLYYLRSRGIRPVARAGNAKVYGEDVLSLLRVELESDR